MKKYCRKLQPLSKAHKRLGQTDERQTDFRMQIPEAGTSRSHDRIEICAVCGIFSGISVLLTTENSDDLEIRVPSESKSLKLESYTS